MLNRNDKERVLVLSTESDTSTTSVLEWLTYFGMSFYRINYIKDDVTFLSSDLENTIISVNGEVVNLKDFTAFWYRKGVIHIENYQDNYLGTPNLRLKRHLDREEEDLVGYIYNEFAADKKAVTTVDNIDVNKLEVLKLAKRCGLDIPYTKIVTSKADVVDLFKKHTTLITKPVSGSHLTIVYNDKRYMTFTTNISESNLDEIPELFLPSTVQECINKKYEIRSFYFFGTFYSMVIFSQQIEQTSTDFRKYSQEYPNRTMPFKLPLELEKKMKNLMDLLEVNTGSIDLIYSEDEKFVFLEVNPVGQFGMVSFPCNYNIEKVIANHFIN